MPCRTVEALAVTAVALLGACAHNRPAQPTVDARPGRGGPTVIAADELHEGSVGLMDLLQRHLANMQVLHTAECPLVYLRGRSTVMTPSNPTIYVDGQEAANTCILETLNSLDLDRVEVYPSGVSNRPGYRTAPYGLIIIFLRRSGP